MSNILVNLSIVFSKPTGISNYATNLFPYLKAINPTLLTAQNYPEFNCYPVPDNLTPAQGTKGHLNRLIWTQFELPQISKKLKSQLLFSPLPEAPLFSNSRFVVMVHDFIPLRFPKRFSPLLPYHRYYIPQVVAQAQHVICNSQATANDIIKFCQIPASKITPIPLAHDGNHYYPLKDLTPLTPRQSPQRREPPHSAGSLPYKGRGEFSPLLAGEGTGERSAGEGMEERSNCPYYLYIGRHDPYKNLHRLIAAFAAIPNCKDYELWLAGSTDARYTPALLTLAEELNISDRVKFLDYVSYNQLPKIINNAIALVFPSLWEGFGFPVLEAMACGTPVITSNLSSLPEVAGDAAILINPYNTSEITEAMQTIATDRELRDRLSAQSIIRANQFNWQKTGLATVEVLKKYL
ncbi:glycosyltransferase family 4 protein [Hassallia byssoidea VB512170]|uniref:Glycosyltransferase family 4 protein n=1 Tax=Hassallia byssoidea VB512170 TaxID=1304833 RepID=A0A846H975_9CYAN|nr:glycosyltransferase family 1 protein [Hassalia byssoidea]NEU74127.1 glycosyltransferase family 4 protein [Hassalia byssoidea VB512170]